MSTKQIFRAAVKALVCVSLVVLVAACANAPTSGSRDPVPIAAPTSLVHGASGPIPGANPAIQRWFLSIDKAKAAFNNALFKAQQGIKASSSPACGPLDQTAKVIVAALPKLRSVPSPAGAKIADAVQPLMDTMAQVAALCRSGDFAGAQALLSTTGIPQQAATQQRIDEILDGEA